METFTLPRWKPTALRPGPARPGLHYLVRLEDGRTVWGNGWLLEVTTTPPKSLHLRADDGSAPESVASYARAMGRALNADDRTPLAITGTHLAGQTLLVLLTTPKGQTVALDAQGVSYLRSRYCTLTFHGSRTNPQVHPVLVRHGGEVVAIVMPYHLV